VSRVATHLRRHALQLAFREDSPAHLNLSGLAFSDEWMWVAGDETPSIERLRPLGTTHGTVRYGDATTFALADVLDLPGRRDDEADLEGLAVHDGWLWLTGSHGLKRPRVKDGLDAKENAKRLARTKLDGNRRLIARVPIEAGPDGAPQLVRVARDGRRSQRLKGDAEQNQLTRRLAADPHLAPFLAIPGKDNGFDIEGLAVARGHLLLGLRGPVLRGQALLLEIHVAGSGEWLELAPLDAAGTFVRKHFLDLGGRGVRDLHVEGGDLWLLAGPTMVLDGDVGLFHWAGGCQALGEAPVSFHAGGPRHVLDLPHRPGADRAEAFARMPDGEGWAVLYDSPAPDRLAGDGRVSVDLLRGM
jgi:hypothetical protein